MPVSRRLRAYLAWVGLIGSTLSGCAPTLVAHAPAPGFTSTLPARHFPTPSGAIGPEPAGVTTLANLPGWAEEDHAAAFAAFVHGCSVARDPALQTVCQSARALGPVGAATARTFLETHFRPQVLNGPGVLTGYFAPEYPARMSASAEFSAPVRSRPPDLMSASPPAQAAFDPATAAPPPTRPMAVQVDAEGGAWPYPDRAGIELIPPDTALAYMRPEDLFFMQIQGSGVLDLPDGRRLRATYAGDNGRPFIAIAQPMVRQGLLAPDQASGTAIRAWLRAHRGPEAEAIMDLNPRYIFFQLEPDDAAEPAGAAGLRLTAGRAIAIDPAWHGYGEVYWIDAAAPSLRGASRAYRRLVMALDTGSAIKGDVRADLYVGRGVESGVEAGRIRHTLLMIKLVPVASPERDAGPGAGRDQAPPSAAGK